MQCLCGTNGIGATSWIYCCGINLMTSKKCQHIKFTVKFTGAVFSVLVALRWWIHNCPISVQQNGPVPSPCTVSSKSRTFWYVVLLSFFFFFSSLYQEKVLKLSLRCLNFVVWYFPFLILYPFAFSFSYTLLFCVAILLYCCWMKSVEILNSAHYYGSFMP